MLLHGTNPGLINTKRIKNSLKNFYDCLKDNGILYIDTTKTKDLKSSKTQIINYPSKNLNGDKVILIDKVTSIKKNKVRIWEPTIYLNDKKYSLKRYSHFLEHNELINMLKDSGFSSISKRNIKGEKYEVFIAKK